MALQRFSLPEFPEIAYQAFRKLQGSIHYRDIIRWVLTSDIIPEQDVTSEFGQPPVTLYKAPLFYIEALFWLDGTTSVHQHAFSGAFHVLAGSSIHSQFTFRRKEEISARFVLGELQLRKTEYLSKGETRRILPGNQFIHSLFHLDFPSVTIVIRTYREPVFAPQYDYRPPFLALDPFSIPSLTRRRIQILDTLQQISSQRKYFREIIRLIPDSDFETTYYLLSHSYPHLDQAQFESLLGAAKTRHGSLIDLIVPVLDEEVRQQSLADLRKPVKNPEHRFFLALLLNLKDQKSIFDFVRKRYSGDPAKRIRSWMKELTDKKTSLKGENALGIHWNETSNKMMDLMLSGLSFPAILKEFQEEYSREQVQKQKRPLYVLYSAFRNSIFRALFQTSYKSPELLKTKIVSR